MKSAWWMSACGVVLAVAASAQAPQRPMPTLPLTQLDLRAMAGDLDNRSFTLTFAQPVPIEDLLLLLVRGTSLSVVPDPGISGSFIGEIKNVTVRQALGLMLRPLGLDYALEGSVVRVFKREPETRIFDLNYIVTERVGGSTVSGEAGKSVVTVSTSTRIDLFDELAKGVKTLLTERAAFNVDRKAGLLQVTDFPERLDRVSVYLDAVQERAHRQVRIDARVIEVEANDERAAGIDWTVLAAQLVATQTPALRAAPRPSLTGLRITDLSKLMDLLAAQGKVTMLANPQLLTLNNEPSIVRTDLVTFSVTPQISSDAVVTLSLSPIVKGPPPLESDMIARVADGETLVVSGLTRDREVRERKNMGTRGAWFGRVTVVTHRRVELLILLTPKIVAAVAAS